MVRIKRIIVNGSAIMLKDENRIPVLRGLLADLLDVTPVQITFTFDTLEGSLMKEDPIIESLQKLKDESLQDK